MVNQITGQEEEEEIHEEIQQEYHNIAHCYLIIVRVYNLLILNQD